jgi:hypothetical protein
MRLSRARLAPLFLVLLSSSAAPLWAQPLDRSGSGALTGTFVSADTLQVVVRTDENVIVAFSVDDQASVPAGLVPGMRVTVRYAMGDDGRYRVVRVGVASYPPEPGSTTSLPRPPAEVASPPPPAASPSPPPAAAGPSAALAGRVPAEPRRAAARGRTAGRVRETAVPATVPARVEPTPEPTAPAEEMSAEITAPPEPSADRLTAHLLKLGGLLLMAGGLLALAYAFLRGYA